MLPDTPYAMDTNFWTSLGHYSIEARCDIVAELGYAGVFESLNTGFDRTSLRNIEKEAAARKVPLAGVYLTADLSKPDSDWVDVRALLEQLESCHDIELAVHASAGIAARPDAALRDRLLTLLKRVAEAAERYGKRVSLYPHIWFYIERIEQAVAAARQVGSDRIGVAFTAFHWYAVDGKSLRARLQEASPYLRRVNLCGSRRLPEGTRGLPATIECLDEGELDNAAVMAVLHDIGFAGPIGVQGYSNGGDPYLKLKRSLVAYRSMRERVLRSTAFARHVG